MFSISPAALAIIFDEEGTSVLLVKRRDVPIWVLPGGGIDSGESAEQAAARETLEETGYRVEVISHVAEYHPINRLSAQTSTFLCKIVGGEPRISDETADLRFFSLNELPKELFFLHRDWLNDARTASGFVQKPIWQVTYLRLLLFIFCHPAIFFRFLYK